MPVTPSAVVAVPAVAVAAAVRVMDAAEAREEAPEPVRAAVAVAREDPVVARQETEGGRLQEQVQTDGRPPEAEVPTGPAEPAAHARIRCATIQPAVPADPLAPVSREPAVPPDPAGPEGTPPEAPSGAPVGAPTPLQGPELMGVQHPEDGPAVGADRRRETEVPVADPPPAAPPAGTAQVVAEDSEEVTRQAAESALLPIRQFQAPEGVAGEQLRHHEPVPVGSRPSRDGSVGAHLRRGRAAGQQEPREERQEEGGERRRTPGAVSHGRFLSPVGRRGGDGGRPAA